MEPLDPDLLSNGTMGIPDPDLLGSGIMGVPDPDFLDNGITAACHHVQVTS